MFDWILNMSLIKKSGHWRPFTLMFFSKKRFDMLSQCHVPSITKKVISYSLVLEQQSLTALQIQNVHLSISMYPEINKAFFNSKLFLK